MMNMRNADFEDIDEVVDLHIQAFPGFFLTSLGKGFLKELYAGFLTDSTGIFVVARNEGGLVGFAAGTSEPEAFFADLRRRRGAVFAIKAIPAIVKNPLPVCRKLFYAVRYRGEAPAARSSGALLSSIGIATSAIGTGIAGSLILAFENEVLKRGVKSVYLTTDVQDNDRVNAFYAKHGYVVLDRFKQNGRRDMFRYEKILAS